MQKKEFHWLAGLLEGEGYFGKKSNGGLQVALDMTDRDIVKKAARLLGVNMLGPYAPYEPTNPKHHERFRASVVGKRAAAWMMTLYCLMGMRRQMQIERALSYWRFYVRRPSGFGAMKLRPGWKEKHRLMTLARNPWSLYGKCRGCGKGRSNPPGQNCAESKHEKRHNAMLAYGRRRRRLKSIR